MLRIFRILRTSNGVKDLEEALLHESGTALVTARRILDNPRPDTFLGRKTQEPFPCEDKGDE